MPTHESSVDYQNLIRDLSEMYPFDTAEVVFVELVANSLDAKPTRIWVDLDSRRKVLTVTDNGKGMTGSDFAQYHDFAAGLKTRGTGIGFAGLGAKVAFNIATRVLTETRSQSFAGGSDWHFQSAKKLVWDDIRPTHLNGYGTRVEVIFQSNARLPYSTTGDLVGLLKRHYLPLLDISFLDLYERLGYYSSELRFSVNRQQVEPSNTVRTFALQEVREFFPSKAGKRIGYGILGLAPSEYPIGADLCGVLLCTWGKVIKSDLFNQFPANIGPRILGLVEIPEFVNFLTTSKTDFMRRRRLREFERIYDPVRREFRDWLQQLGVQPTVSAETADQERLERELKKLLEDVPELSEFFGFRTRKDILQSSSAGTTDSSLNEGVDVTFPTGNGEAGAGPGPVDAGDYPGEALVEDRETGTQPAKPISRISRRGPKIAFLDAPDKFDLAWVDGNNIVINSGHSAYRKVRSEVTARRLHSLFAVAIAVHRFLASEGGAGDLMFTDRMMSAWGNK